TSGESVPTDFKSRFGTNVIERLFPEEVFVRGIGKIYQVAPSPWVVHTAKVGAEVELPSLKKRKNSLFNLKSHLTSDKERVNTLLLTLLDS
ncbi:MAG: hypothetical protein QXN62_04040, partial [Candidatus Bathyarchaeia archaeon]